MKQGWLIRSHNMQPLLFLLATILSLSLAYVPVGWSLLAWVAWTPWILACRPELSRRRLMLWSYLAAALYWIVSLRWIHLVTIPGWIGVGLYLALTWPLISLALQTCRRRQWPLSWAAAIIITGAEAAQGFPLGGFFWRLLAHSQARQLTVIQISDLFGASGITFLIAFVNGTLAEVILSIRHQEKKRLNVAGQVLLAIVLVSATLAYGHWRLAQTPGLLQTGPRVGAVQSNVPQSVKEVWVSADKIATDVFQQSRACQAAGADLIIWPETMVQVVLDQSIRPYLVDHKTGDKIDAELRNHARKGSYLLVGAYGGKLEDNGRDLTLEEANSAFLYRPDGSQYPQRYDKMHLVLFGEYLPFRHVAWLHNLMMKFAPYHYDYSLVPGTHPTIFPMTCTNNAGVSKTYHFSVLICYEDVVPSLARQRILDPNGQKQIQWLVNSSNDGWFIRPHDPNQRGHATAELAQHLYTCVFRAVENRVPIIRSVNTGISALIDSTGAIHTQSLAASPNWPTDPLKRTGLAGWFIDKMPIDPRVTFYTRTGPWLDRLCLTLWCALWLWEFITGVREFRQQKITKRLE